jgi:hypothetical protein
MSATERIPRNIELFMAFMRRTVAFLLANSPAPFTNLNWQRLNWTNQEVIDWQAFLTAANPLLTIYEASPKGNPANTRALHLIITKTHVYDKKNHPLDRVAAGNPLNMFDADYTAFNIKHNAPVLLGSLPTERKVATLNIVSFSMRGVGSGTMHYLARANKSSKHAHKLAGYNLGIIWLILNEGDVTPTTTDLLTQKETSTRADNVLHLAENLSRKRIAVSMFWQHKTNKHLDGPKSPIQVIVIV